MKTGSIKRVLQAGALLLLAGSVVAQGAEIRVMVSGGFVPIMKDIGPKFERATGNKLVVASDTLGAIVKRVQAGEAFDVVLSPRSAIEGFVKSGKAAADNVTVLASAGMGVAVRKGAPKPDVSSPEAFKRALLAAKSITYPDPNNPAANPLLGIHVNKVLDRLGISNEMKPKTVFSLTTIDVGELVASGEAELAIAQVQNLARSAGIEMAGPLPAELQDPVIFAAVILGSTGNAGASKALVDFMRTPEAAAAIKAQHLDPAGP